MDGGEIGRGVMEMQLQEPAIRPSPEAGTYETGLLIWLSPVAHFHFSRLLVMEEIPLNYYYNGPRRGMQTTAN
jgi:hypothetical protein